MSFSSFFKVRSTKMEIGTVCLHISGCKQFLSSEMWEDKYLYLLPFIYLPNVSVCNSSIVFTIQVLDIMTYLEKQIVLFISEYYSTVQVIIASQKTNKLNNMGWCHMH
jgi:hypothetical protein